METKTDLLREWKENVSAMKFKMGIANANVFVAAIRTEEILRDFFSPNDYTLSNREINEDNYLIYLLCDKSLQAVHLLNEMAGLIEYAKEQNQDVSFKSKNNVVAHAGLSNALFEVHTNWLLKKAGFNVFNKKSYTDSNGNERPLDGYFEFNGKPYLVECYKIVEPVSKSITRLNEYLMRISLKRKIHNYQAFVGHIGFKTNVDLAQWVDKAKGKVLQLYKQYLHAFNTDGLSIMIPKKYSTEGFDIDITPYHMAKSHDAELKDSYQLYSSLVSFQTKPKFDRLDSCEFIISGSRVVNDEENNEKLFQKVRAKLSQHKDAPFNKIFFIEIDTTRGINPNNPIFPFITKERVDFSRFGELVNPDTIIVMVFKEASNTGIKYEMGFLNIENQHSEIVKAFHQKKYSLGALGLISVADFMRNMQG
jgi:hypothetical protein